MWTPPRSSPRPPAPPPAGSTWSLAAASSGTPSRQVGGGGGSAAVPARLGRAGHSVPPSAGRSALAGALALRLREGRKSTGDNGGGGVTIEAGFGRKERTGTRLGPGEAAQTTLPRRAAAVYAAAAGKENVQPKGRGQSTGKAGAPATPTPGDTPSRGDAAPGASAPCLYRREAPRATPPACTPSPLNPSDTPCPPSPPENHPASPKSTQKRPGAPRDGQPRRTAEPTGRRRRPAVPGNAWHCLETAASSSQQRPAAPKGGQARHTTEPVGRRRRPATPDNACRRQATTPSNAQQRPATHRSGPKEKRGSEAAPGGPISASPPMRTQQEPPTSGNPPVSGGKPPPTATPAGLRHSRWDGRRRGGSAAALGERGRAGRPGACVEQGTAQNPVQPFLSRAACRTASGDRGTANHLPSCEISASRGCRGARNLDRQAPRQAMPDSCKTRSARDHLRAGY